MTPDERFAISIGVTIVTNAVIVGAAWGSLRSGQRQMHEEVDDVRRALGLKNGSPGKFVTREEVALLRERAEDEHVEIRRRLQALEESR